MKHTADLNFSLKSAFAPATHESVISGTNGTRILIAGCGISGRAAAQLAASLGFSFSLLDEKDNADLREFAASLEKPPKEIFFGYCTNQPLPGYDVVVMSPGFRSGNPVRVQLERQGARVMGELEFALSHWKKPFIGITGTNGKTTTTELTSALFCAAGVPACACGNNGYAASNAVIDGLNGRVDLPIVEISSFQLELIPFLCPQAAAVLNLASDHIDRHGSMEAYSDAKFRLLGFEKTICVVNARLEKEFLSRFPNRSAITFSADSPADFQVKNGTLIGFGKPLLPVNRMRLSGMHNVENALAALALLSAVNGKETAWSPSVLETLHTFQAGEHRLELFLEKNGVRYYNDSKATNPHAVNAALKTIGEGRNVIVLLGGQDKGMNFSELKQGMDYVKHAFVFGTCAPAIAKVLADCSVPFTLCDSLEGAVRQSVNLAEKRDIVLLSPATASMDLFRDYRDRGDQFKSLCRLCTDQQTPR